MHPCSGCSHYRFCPSPYQIQAIRRTVKHHRKWVEKAVQAAEILFDAPKSGEAKRAYVIRFVSQMFNSKKEVITDEQIRILLEAALQQMLQGKAA